MHIQLMREFKYIYTTRSLGRIALAIGLAIPLNFATARPDETPVPSGHLAEPAARTITVPASALAPARADVGLLRPGISGTARVLDGDTIDIDGTRIRLEGIDAPERAQTCTNKAGTIWRCGRTAQRALTKMVADQNVRCDSRGRGSYGRMLGVCYVDGREINAQMVRRGLAWAFVKYSRRYVGLEATARTARRGIWQGKAMPAWDYRSNRWANVEGIAPKGCAIKGNISRKGHIYHMPWGRWYGRVKIDKQKGERWFCREVDAVNAGWRAVAMR